MPPLRLHKQLRTVFTFARLLRKYTVQCVTSNIVKIGYILAPVNVMHRLFVLYVHLLIAETNHESVWAQVHRWVIRLAKLCQCSSLYRNVAFLKMFIYSCPPCLNERQTQISEVNAFNYHNSCIWICAWNAWCLCRDTFWRVYLLCKCFWTMDNIHTNAIAYQGMQ